MFQSSSLNEIKLKRGNRNYSSLSENLNVQVNFSKSDKHKYGSGCGASQLENLIYKERVFFLTFISGQNINTKKLHCRNIDSRVYITTSVKFCNLNKTIIYQTENKIFFLQLHNAIIFTAANNEALAHYTMTKN